MKLVWGPHCWWGKNWCANEGARRTSRKALIRVLDLAESEYVSGGWELNVSQHPGMRCADGGFQIADELPNCKKVDANGHQIVFCHDKDGTRMQLWVNGAEAPAGYSAPAGTWVGVGITGN